MSHGVQVDSGDTLHESPGFTLAWACFISLFEADLVTDALICYSGGYDTIVAAITFWLGYHSKTLYR